MKNDQDTTVQPLTGESAIVEPTEISGIAIVGDTIVVAGDETTKAFARLHLGDTSRAHAMPFPPDADELDDIEDITLGPDGRTIYAITSNSLTKKGKEKPERMRLGRYVLNAQATSIVSATSVDGLRTHLLKHLTQHAATLGLSAEPTALPPAGLDIEGMAWWKGNLLIGLRAPIAKDGRPVVLTLRKPIALFETKQPDFSDPRFLPNGMSGGVRGMTEYPARDSILLLLGPSGDEDSIPFQIVRWHPDKGEAHVLSIPGLAAIKQPEAIAITPDGNLMVAEDRKDGGQALHRLVLP